MLFPDKKYTAPLLDTPDPLTYIFSATVIPPDICRVAPSETVVFPEVVPNALAFDMARVPVLMVTVPLKVFVPDRINVPEPDFVREPDPDITPDNVWFELVAILRVPALLMRPS